jgi:hypothetical protein
MSSVLVIEVMLSGSPTPGKRMSETRHFQHWSCPHRKKSTTRAEWCRRAGHLVALVDKLRDDAEERATGSAFVELDIGRGQALDNNVHDLRNDIPDLSILMRC